VDAGSVVSGAPDSTTCYNCGTPLRGPFCSDCGQKAGPLDPTVHDFLHDFSHEMLHVDGRIFRSVWKLLSAPGFLTREQFDGRRAKWVSPIRLYLIFSLAYFAAVSFAGSGIDVVQTENDPEATAILQRLGFDSPAALEAAVEDARDHWGPRAMFLLVPVFAWLVGVAWKGRGRHYPQHLYFALHVHAAWFAVAALVELSTAFAPSALARSLGLIPVVYGFLYVVLAFRRAYGATWSQSLGRTMAILLAYFMVVGFVAIGVALLVIFGHDNATATAFHTSAATACRSRPASTLIQPGFDA